MSLTNAMNSATSGLLAQSKALASISSNIANSSTTGYKSTSTSFESFLNRKNTIDEDTGGVRAYNNRNISAQGDITTTTTATNLAVDGDGFFTVATEQTDGKIVYTRDGSFTKDNNGYLVNKDGYYLYGWQLDQTTGKILATNKSSTASLSAINVDNLKGDPKATSAATIQANLPSDIKSTQYTAGVFTTTSDLEVFDGRGASSSVPITWSHNQTDVNPSIWTVTLGDAANTTSPYAIYSSSDSKTVTGQINGGGAYTFTVEFDSNGKLQRVQDSAGTDINTAGTAGIVNLPITWADTSTSSLTVDLGTIGFNDGLTNTSSGETTPAIRVDKVSQNGYAPGKMTGVTIDKDGYVNAAFDNGQTQKVYKVPVATFANEDGMKSLSGSVFQQTVESGTVQLNDAGVGHAGAITPSAVESSTVELTDEFSRMITTQQIYSAAAKVITTTDTMMTTLVDLKR